MTVSYSVQKKKSEKKMRIFVAVALEFTRLAVNFSIESYS